MTDNEARTLEIGGRRLACIEKCPPGALFDLADLQEEEQGHKRLLGMKRFLFTVVRDEEHERLTAILNDREDPPSFADIDVAIGNLMTAYVARPTERPSHSSPGPEASGGVSRVVSLSRGTVREVETSSTDGTRDAS